MADDEAELAAEIARLEAELLKARQVSKQHHLKQELAAVKNVLDDEEFMIIQDLIDDAGDDEYVEVTEQSYDDEEEVEEEEYTEEEYSEYEEVTDNDGEEVDEDEPVDVVQVAPQPSQAAPVRSPFFAKKTPPALPLPEQSPKESLKTAVQSGQQNLRRTPWSRKEVDSTAKIETESVSPLPKATAPSDDNPPRTKKIVRPPPSKGGKPVARVDPKEATKAVKKFPLTNLIKRNDEKKEQKAPASEPKPESAKEPKEESAAEKKKKVIRRIVKRNVAAKPAAPAKTQAVSADSPFKRRPIPNLQPSTAGDETIFEQLLGPQLITNPKLHKCSTKGCVKDQELICFYFGAVWKSDCKRFNALLKDFYYSVAQQTNLEVVYISADRSLIEFKDCYTTMPFLAMPAGTTSLKNELTKALKVIEMPALVVLDDEGNVVTVEGVQKIQELEKGNAKDAMKLVDRWKKTRPIPIAEVQLDKSLLHGTMERGTIYWQG